MANNTVPVPVNREIYDAIKKVVANRKMTMSVFCNTILKEFISEYKEDKILLTIPYELTENNKDDLSDWVSVRMKAIVESYYGNGDE